MDSDGDRGHLTEHAPYEHGIAAEQRESFKQIDDGDRAAVARILGDLLQAYITQQPWPMLWKFHMLRPGIRLRLMQMREEFAREHDQWLEKLEEDDREEDSAEP